MKRKKWSEAEEKTLLQKCSQLLNSTTLSKFKSREKKLKPIADHVNSIHNLQEEPSRWSWRDVSIKIQNMRHQYLGVKQKIKNSNNNFNWNDGQYLWDNFLLYKDVFGDVEHNSNTRNVEEDVFNVKEDEESKEGEEAEMFEELKGMMVRREEKRREREWSKEELEIGKDRMRKERIFRKYTRDIRLDDDLEEREIEFEYKRVMWARKEGDRRVRLEEEFDEERMRRRMKFEEEWEEEEMHWKEMMVGMQIQHEKEMMQLHIDACQNQMQVLGFIARMSDGLAGGLGALSAQVMQNLHDAGDDRKLDTNSPSQFL